MASTAQSDSQAAALHASEERLRATFDNAPLGIAVADLNLRFLEINQKLAEMLGYTVDELRGRIATDVTHPDDLPDTRQLTQRLLAGQIPHYLLEKRYLRKDGSILWSRATISLLKDAAGRPTQFIGIVEDISEHKEADELRRRLAAVVESSDDAILSQNLQGLITTWNPGAQRMFGYSAAQTLGHSSTMLIPPELHGEERRILDEIRRGERIEHFETLRIRKDGTRFKVSLTISPIKDEGGQIIGASKIARDITRQWQSEESLREERRILEVLNTTGTAIAAQLDVATLVQMVTDATTQLSGAQFGAFFYNVVAANGEPLWQYALAGAPREAFAKFEIPRHTALFKVTFGGESVLRSGDITRDPRYGQMGPHFGTPQGHPPVRSYLAVPVISRTGQVLGGLVFGHPEPDRFTERAQKLVVGVAAQAATAIDNARLYEAAQREIASRERAEEALREADRRKDEFLATLAHELRNPLAPIRQAVLISKSEGATEAQKRWSHDVISRQVQHMSLLLDDLLDVSRITRGTLELRTQMTELETIVDAAVETARPAIDAKRHELTVELPRHAVRFAADPLRIAQVLANLLTNAAKYTDPDGQIRLVAQGSADTLTLRVTDTGIGIPPEATEHVFAMFSQVKSGYDRSEGGLGIGLALAKGLVELHGGQIEARSGGFGMGSEFTVRLPIRTIGAAGNHCAAQKASSPSPRRKVLIADDNQDAAASLGALLEMEGHEVTVVHDGPEALSAFSRVHPEVALLDIGMPGMSGYEVARKVRHSAPGKSVMLIAVTGWGQDRDKAQALAAGFDHHFTKPIDPERLSLLLR